MCFVLILYCDRWQWLGTKLYIKCVYLFSCYDEDNAEANNTCKSCYYGVTVLTLSSSGGELWTINDQVWLSKFDNPRHNWSLLSSQNTNILANQLIGWHRDIIYSDSTVPKTHHTLTSKLTGSNKCQTLPWDLGIIISNSPSEIRFKYYNNRWANI